MDKTASNWVHTPAKANIGRIPRVHCLVHPGFDAGNHPEFEASLHQYIEYIATKTKDILLIVSDGEIFDGEQRKHFAHLYMIEWISLFLWLHDGGMGDLIRIYDDGKYNKTLENNGFDERFYRWCKRNIDMSEFQTVADEWRELRKEYHDWKYRDNKECHSKKAAILREKEEQTSIKIDIESLSKKALNDLWVLTTPMSPTRRVVRNRPRFNRLYQHALQVLGKERMREIFIADTEQEDKVPILPISHFITLDNKFLSTPITPTLSHFQTQVFNASGTQRYGSAAELRDEITYELSLSRSRKLLSNQPAEVLQDMNFPITPETKFIFFGEYRGRCVSNTAMVMRARLKWITGENFYIAHDKLTLLREDDREEEWIF